MEASAKHDFVATSNDELSFNKGDKLKIINMTDDINWFKAEKQGKEGWIPTNYINLTKFDWFLKNLTRAEAENLLMERTETNEYLHADGAFVVRPSESSPTDFSLSVKFGDLIQHFKVLRDGAGKYFLWVVKFDSLNDLVKYHRTASVSRTQTVYLTDRTIVKRIADYDYEAKEELEMTFKRGDIINVLNKTDPNWWTGEITKSNGEIKEGLFPKTYTSDYTCRK